MQLYELPIELLLAFMEYLPLHDIANLRLCARDFNIFVKQNDIVYRQAAFLLGFARSPMSLEKAKLIPYDSDWLESAETWHELCVRHTTMERRWRYLSKEYRPQVSSILAEDMRRITHRVKIDEQDRTIISTSQGGGLTVRCTVSHKILWELPRNTVRKFAHLEYSEGFAVFDSWGSEHEVWIKKSLLSHYAETSQPETRQILNEMESICRFTDETSVRGVYVPYRILHNPVQTRAYRFIFPELLVASQIECSAHIWNVVTGEILEDYSLRLGAPTGLPAEEDEGANLDDDLDTSIQYVELSAQHIFVCFGKKLVVYARAPFKVESGASGPANTATENDNRKEAIPVLELPPTEAQMEINPRAWHSVSMSGSWGGGSSGNTVLSDSHTTRIVPPAPYASTSKLWHHCNLFRAVHVSPDGLDLVATSTDGYMVYVRDFAKILVADGKSAEKGSISSAPGIWALVLDSPVHNLAFDGRRVAFSTLDRVSILELDENRHSTEHGFPSSIIKRLHSLGRCNDVSSLQMTKASVWFAVSYRWHQAFSNSDQARGEGSRVVHVDFSRNAQAGDDSTTVFNRHDSLHDASAVIG